MERELFTATYLGDTLEYFALKQEPSKISDKPILPLKYSLVSDEKRAVDTYASLMNGQVAL